MLSALVADRIDEEVSSLRPLALATADARATAFRRLVGFELDRAYRLAAVILGDRFEAEDAVHDAAENAWRRWSDLRDPDRFEAWFGRILVNVCRDRLRRRGRRTIVELHRSVLESEHPAVPDAADGLAARDLLRRIPASLVG